MMKSILLFATLLLAGISFSQVGTVRNINELNVVSEADAYPCLLDDGLTLYFVNNGSGTNELYVSRRATTSDPWGPKEIVTSVVFSGLV